jgi:hypothetical protein
MSCDSLAVLERWFLSNCDGDWEHGNSIKIQTLDNPGWTIQVSLEGTHLEGMEFESIRIERSDQDWIRCDLRNNVMSCFCGPQNLQEALQIVANTLKRAP